MPAALCKLFLRKPHQCNHSLTQIYLSISAGRMFHSATRLNKNDILIYGGRTSPSKPSLETLLLSLEDNVSAESKSSNFTNSTSHCCLETGCQNNEDLQSSRIVKPSYKQTVLSCQGEIPEPRWRHTATHVVLPDGTPKHFVFFEFDQAIASLQKSILILRLVCFLQVVKMF